MKKIMIEFLKRGCTGCGLGPIVLTILYYILYTQGNIETLSVPQVCTAIVSITLLAFVASGINVIYQIETCPLMVAIFIHGCVLYICYLITYLLNDWLVKDKTSILYFTLFFVRHSICNKVFYANFFNDCGCCNLVVSRQHNDDNAHVFQFFY